MTPLRLRLTGRSARMDGYAAIGNCALALVFVSIITWLDSPARYTAPRYLIEAKLAHLTTRMLFNSCDQLFIILTQRYRLL